MPVLVTAATSPLGQLLVPRLLAEGGEVRAWCDPDGEAGRLRAAGAIVATGEPDDEGRLEAAMAQVHTAIHLDPGPLAADADELEVAGLTARTAAVNAGVRRFIHLSVPGADPSAADPLRAVEGRLEAALRDAPIPTVVVRASLIATPQLADALAAVPGERGSVASVAPVRPADLVEGLAALDAVRSEAHTGHVVFAADGPERMPIDELVGRLGRGSRIGRRYVSGADVALLVASLEDDWVTDDGTVFDLWEFVGHRPTPVGGG